jgi:AcrR family transcriptional regulator
VRSVATASRRAAILNAALDLFVTKGFLATTMDDVRRRSGASIGSIYHHFGSKEELAAALYVEGLRDYQNGYLGELERHAGAEAAVKAVVGHHLNWIASNRDLARFLFQHRDPELRRATKRPLGAANRRFFKTVTSWLEAQTSRGAIRQLPHALYYALWIAPVQEFGRRWLRGHADTPIDQAAGILADAAWRSLASPERSDVAEPDAGARGAARSRGEVTESRISQVQTEGGAAA